MRMQEPGDIEEASRKEYVKDSGYLRRRWKPNKLRYVNSKITRRLVLPARSCFPMGLQEEFSPFVLVSFFSTNSTRIEVRF